MTAKTYLRRIKWNEIKIEQKKFQLRGLGENIDYLHAIDYSKDKVQTSPRDIIGEQVAKMTDMKIRIVREIAAFEVERDKAINQIQSMTDGRYSAILFKRYVEGKEFLTIAKETGYDFNYTRNMHGEALRAFETRFLMRGGESIG